MDPGQVMAAVAVAHHQQQQLVQAVMEPSPVVAAEAAVPA